MKPLFTMREALADPNLLGDVLVGDSWSAWRAMLIAFMGEPLTESERAIFTRFTGRAREPLERVDEAAFVVGRRGGKDRAASVLATYIAGLCEHPKLVRDERGVLMLLAPDTDQAAIQLRYIKAPSRRARCCAGRSSTPRATLSRCSTETTTAAWSPTSTSRFTPPTSGACAGERASRASAPSSAFWYDAETSANPDTEIVGAARPALLTTNGPMIFISSPYARRGVLWNMYRRHYGADGDPLILVAQARAPTSIQPFATTGR